MTALFALIFAGIALVGGAITWVVSGWIVDIQSALIDRRIRRAHRAR